MKGAPPSKADEQDRIYAIIKSVDERGRAMDERWGCGRLPTLVSPEWADRFTSQSAKFNQAVWNLGLPDVLRHGEAMIRAYDKLDELATLAGHTTTPPEQWEFETADGLVILVRERSRMNQVQTHGRRCQVWALEEIASVIRNAKIVAECKLAFPGAEIVDSRPGRTTLEELNEAPF